jgi:hypothetical protein
MVNNMSKKSIHTMLYSIIIAFSVCQVVSAEIIEINFAYVGENNHPALLGVKQGLDESNIQGQFLNQKYNLDFVSTSDISTHDFSKYIAVLSSVDAVLFKKLTTTLPDMSVFNLTNDDNDLRSACINNALHIIPSNKMSVDALAQWKKKKPESQAVAQAWHSDFVKFAARDLNKRFKKNYGAPMNDYSWAGWAAVKMTTDTVARTQIHTPKKMLNYLKTDLSFDGQKGSNMNFRETGQLRQLLLLVEDSKITAEAPVRGIAKPPTLDSLGILNCG